MSDTQQAPENASIQTFLTELASAAPTPGGGGAAAISGAMGAALVSMVCNLTIGKKKYVEVEAELKEVATECALAAEARAARYLESMVGALHMKVRRQSSPPPTYLARHPAPQASARAPTHPRTHTLRWRRWAS